MIMNTGAFLRLATAVAACALVSACGLFKSTESKQVDACVEDVKRALHDPGSFELLSHRGFEVKDETWRVEIKYTAKNRMGGRGRDESLCGFKSKDSAEWNPDDLYNALRDTAVQLREAGIDLN